MNVPQRVKRSCNGDNIISTGGLTKEQALKDSWDYWEKKRGLEHPMKRERSGIKRMTPILLGDLK